ncbi:MAG: V4R domain-containing protein [Candidatus Aenigmatarchaeota archaeon]
MGSKDFFARMIANGQFVINDSGHAILFGEFVVLTPGGVFLELFEILRKRLGEKGAWKVIQEIGEYQMKAALSRYKGRFNIQNAQSSKILDFLMEILNILGWGLGTLSVDSKLGVAKIVMRNSMLPQKYLIRYGKRSRGPIDYFVLGWMKAMFEAYFGSPVEAAEVLCAAKGDPYCEFVVKAKGQRKRKN